MIAQNICRHLQQQLFYFVGIRNDTAFKTLRCPGNRHQGICNHSAGTGFGTSQCRFALYQHLYQVFRQRVLSYRQCGITQYRTDFFQCIYHSIMLPGKKKTGSSVFSSIGYFHRNILKQRLCTFSHYRFTFTANKKSGCKIACVLQFTQFRQNPGAENRFKLSRRPGQQKDIPARTGIIQLNTDTGCNSDRIGKIFCTDRKHRLFILMLRASPAVPLRPQGLHFLLQFRLNDQFQIKKTGDGFQSDIICSGTKTSA